MTKTSEVPKMISKGEAVHVGICGAGGIIDAHCRAMTRVPGVTPVAISSRTLATARRRAKKHRIPAAYDDHRRVIDHPDVDVVLIATPNYQHCGLALDAFSAGKHVFVEKPLAASVAEGKKMVAAAKKAARHLVYAEQLPLAPKFARLIELAAAGTFGDIYMVRQIERHAGPPSPWFFQKEFAAGGALMDLGCHSISVVREIFPDEKIQGVSAVQRTFQHTHGDVEDFMLLQIHYEGGAVAVVESNWCHLGGMDSITEVFGSKGNGYADLMKGSGLEVFTHKPSGLKWQGDRGWHKPAFDATYENGYQDQIEALANTIRTGAPPAQSGRDGLAILKIMDAAYKSAKHGSKVTSLVK